MDVFVHNFRTGKTTIVSVSSAGVQGNSDSGLPSISADGNLVAFTSFASNLVKGDTNGATDIFVHNRQTGKTTRVSVSSAGRQALHPSRNCQISADGRVVVFQSNAGNLVSGDTNHHADVFVHNLRTGNTTRVSVNSAGAQATAGSGVPSVSAHGRLVAFQSRDNHLVPHDTNDARDVFVHDRRTGQTTRVSVDSSGVQGNDFSDNASISGDGSRVAFRSGATNLIPGGTSITDVFLHDRTTGATTLISVATNGTQPDNVSGFALQIASSGRFVIFQSAATNLVAPPTSGNGDIFLRGPIG